MSAPRTLGDKHPRVKGEGDAHDNGENCILLEILSSVHGFLTWSLLYSNCWRMLPSKLVVMEIMKDIEISLSEMSIQQTVSPGTCPSKVLCEIHSDKMEEERISGEEKGQ